MFKTISMIALCIFLGGCSKKSQTVRDEPPSFIVRSAAGELGGASPSEIALKRSGEGPVLNVISTGERFERLVNAEVTCQELSFRSSDAGARVAGDQIQIQIDASHFKGIERLPLESGCRLKLSLEGARGSTRTRDFMINIKFDKPPQVVIRRSRFDDNLLFFRVRPDNFTLDYYAITNPTAYPILMTFSTTTRGEAYPRYNYTCNISGASAIGGFAKNKFELTASAVLFSGEINRQQFSSERWSFEVPAGGLVEIEVTSEMPAAIPRGGAVSSERCRGTRQLIGGYAIMVDPKSFRSAVSPARHLRILADDFESPLAVENYSEDLLVDPRSKNPAVAAGELFWE